MYKEFFGLKEKPFNVTSDPDFLFLSRVHKEALSHLAYGIKERKGFMEITGEIGAGKTTLCRALLNQLDSRTKTAFILNPTLPETDLFHAIVEDFGLTVEKRQKAAILKQFNNFLLEEASRGNNVVLIVDESQNISLKMLEEIRMLSNLETEKTKLLQIILVGQPELKEKLNSPALKQLRQRISVRFHITPLAKDEVAEYIDHRLKVAGSNGQIEFTEEAVNSIFSYSGGIPRLINVVCDKSLLLAYVMETGRIFNGIVDRSIREIEGVIAR